MSMAAKLMAIAKRAEKEVIKVGFFKDKTYPDGTYVAQNAWLHEYGATVDVPEHDVTIYRKIKKNGEFAKNGRFVKQSQSNFATTHHVDAYSFEIPARPFFRSMIAENKGSWAGIYAKAYIKNPEKAGQMLAMAMQSQLKDSIISGEWAPNSRAVIRRKGFDKPLVDTGLLSNSTGYQVGE